MDKVFVITVCRNAGALLEPTMLSVLAQGNENLQYIIVDGGSTDGTLDVIRKYESRLTVWVSEPDEGIYDAMNKGLRMAKSLVKIDETAWVNFMNAGDCFSDNQVIEDVFSRSVSERVKVIVGDCNRCFTDKKVLNKVESVDFLPAWMPFCHQATFVRLEDYHFDTQYKIAADYHFFYNIYYKWGHNAFLTIDRVIADFRMEDSTTYTNLRQTKREILQIQSRHISWFWLKEYVKWLMHKQ